MSDLSNPALEMRYELESGSRSSVRFPVHLPVQIMAEGQQYSAVTENFSSSGALFCMSDPLPTGTLIQFLMEITPGLIGVDVTAAIHGEGQIVRSYQQNGQNYSAIVINEYSFQ